MRSCRGLISTARSAAGVRQQRRRDGLGGDLDRGSQLRGEGGTGGVVQLQGRPGELAGSIQEQDLPLRDSDPVERRARLGLFPSRQRNISVWAEREGIAANARCSSRAVNRVPFLPIS